MSTRLSPQKTLALVMASLTALSSFALAQRTIYVPTDYLRIQDAINFARDGDTIIVQPGTYHESITWSTKSLTLRGSGAGFTTIDPGTMVRRRCMVMTDVPSTARIEGFTFTNGGATEGGGLYTNRSSPTIVGCVFIANSASSRGGGLYSEGESSRVNIENCTFINNSSLGIGGAMAEKNLYTRLTNCVFASNTAGSSGGAIYFRGVNSSAVNCTVTGNTASEGGSLATDGIHPELVSNCILWGNSAPEIYDERDSAPIIEYCNVQGGYTGTGNIDADPLFVDAALGNFHLLSGSPCVNAGTNTPNAGLPATDIEGNVRIAGDTVDMGAYESPAPEDLVEAIGDFVDVLVDSGVLLPNDGGSLQATLDSAIRGLEEDRPVVSVTNILEAFIRKTEAMERAGRLDERQAQTLILAAQRVIDSIQE